MLHVNEKQRFSQLYPLKPASSVPHKLSIIILLASRASPLHNKNWPCVAAAHENLARQPAAQGSVISTRNRLCAALSCWPRTKLVKFNEEEETKLVVRSRTPQAHPAHYTQVRPLFYHQRHALLSLRGRCRSLRVQHDVAPPHRSLPSFLNKTDTNSRASVCVQGVDGDRAWHGSELCYF